MISNSSQLLPLSNIQTTTLHLLQYCMRELLLDSAIIENERRKVNDTADSKAREKRRKIFALMEMEHAAMNQLVSTLPGLLSVKVLGLQRKRGKF